MKATNSADSASQFDAEGQQTAEGQKTAVGPGRADVPIQRLSAGEFSLTQGKGQAVALFRPSTDWVRPTPLRKGNLF